MVHPKHSFVVLGNGIQRILESCYTLTSFCESKAETLGMESCPPIPPFRVGESGRGRTLIHQIAKNPHLPGHCGLPECSGNRFSIGDMKHGSRLGGLLLDLQIQFNRGIRYADQRSEIADAILCSIQNKSNPFARQNEE